MARGSKITQPILKNNHNFGFFKILLRKAAPSCFKKSINLFFINTTILNTKNRLLQGDFSNHFTTTIILYPEAKLFVR